MTLAAVRVLFAIAVLIIMFYCQSYCSHDVVYCFVGSDLESVIAHVIILRIIESLLIALLPVNTSTVCCLLWPRGDMRSHSTCIVQCS